MKKNDLKSSNIVLVTSIASPYRIPVWNALAKRVPKLTIILFAISDKNRIWETPQLENQEFNVILLKGFSGFWTNHDYGLYFNPQLFSKLMGLKPTNLIVTGYENPSYLIAIIYAKLFRVPLTIWWSSHAKSSRKTKGPIAFLRKTILRLGDSYVTYGKLAASYLQEMKINKDKISIGTNTVDVEKLNKLVVNLKKNLSINKIKKFLFVGQFVKRKGIEELIQAFRKIPESDAILTIVGYGPLASEIHDLITASGRSNIHLEKPTKNIEETSIYYATHDILVMPSHIEVWGLVVNEALASGMYVLAGKNSGAGLDLINDAPTDVGMLFDPSDQVEFYSVLKKAIDINIDREKIMDWGLMHTPEKYANSIFRAVTLAKMKLSKF